VGAFRLKEERHPTGAQAFRRAWLCPLDPYKGKTGCDERGLFVCTIDAVMWRWMGREEAGPSRRWEECGLCQ
jgi:hypothetical protein